MKKVVALLMLCSLQSHGCTNKAPVHDGGLDHLEAPKTPVTKDQAISIARDDAQEAMGKLPEYDIVVTERKDAWWIDFALREKTLNGGGLHYEIDKITGKILHKQYQQ